VFPVKDSLHSLVTSVSSQGFSSQHRTTSHKRASDKRATSHNWATRHKRATSHNRASGQQPTNGQQPQAPKIKTRNQVGHQQNQNEKPSGKRSQASSAIPGFLQRKSGLQSTLTTKKIHVVLGSPLTSPLTLGFPAYH